MIKQTRDNLQFYYTLSAVSNQVIRRSRGRSRKPNTNASPLHWLFKKILTVQRAFYPSLFCRAVKGSFYHRNQSETVWFNFLLSNSAHMFREIPGTQCPFPRILFKRKVQVNFINMFFFQQKLSHKSGFKKNLFRSTKNFIGYHKKTRMKTLKLINKKKINLC